MLEKSEKLLILIIEDDEVIRENIELLLAESYETVSTGNGEEGVSLIESLRPNLILCDRMMPRLSGDGVLEAIQKLPDPSLRLIPFIFVTAKAQSDDVRKGMTEGAWDYLPKPFTRSELLNAVQTQLERYEKARRLIELKVREGERRGRQMILRELPDRVNNPLGQIIACFQLLKDEENPAEREQLIADGLTASGQLFAQLAAYFKEAGKGGSF